MDLDSMIRVVPDFPKPGISFKDITPLLADGKALRAAVEALASRFEGKQFDVVAGPEARGFIFASLLAYHLGLGLVPIRKPGKLPWKTVRHEYQTEYSLDALELHADAIKPGQRVLVCDDVLATGGTIRACVTLVERLGGRVDGVGFLIELGFLGGRSKLQGYDVHSLITY